MLGRPATLRFVRAIGLALALAVWGATVMAQAPQSARRIDESELDLLETLLKNQNEPFFQLAMGMHVMAGDLGVQCGHCHVHGDYKKDDRPLKAVARRMMAMTTELNERNFGGRQVVTCYTCHRGSLRPLTTPTLPVNVVQFKLQPVASGPTSDQILARYVEALGGEQALRRITSRVIVGTRDLPITHDRVYDEGMERGGEAATVAQFEQFAQRPNRLVSTSRTDRFSIAEGYDGTVAWRQSRRGEVMDLPEPDQQRLRRNADFDQNLNLKQHYSRIEVRGEDTVRGRPAYVLAGSVPTDADELLYFDKETGLLVRRISTLPTPQGDSPFQLDYDDYRDIGNGVKFPFLIQATPSDPRAELASAAASIRITEVRTNVVIDGSRFAKPASTPQPAR